MNNEWSFIHCNAGTNVPNIINHNLHTRDKQDYYGNKQQ